MSIFKKIKNPGIFIKFTFAYIIVGLIPLLALSYFALSTVKNQVEDHTHKNYEELMMYSSNRVEDLYNKYNNITKLMYNHSLPELSGIQEIMSDEDNFRLYRMDLEIADVLRPILNTDLYIRNVFFYPAFDEKVRFVSRSNIQFNELKFDLIYKYEQQIKENLTKMTILPVHTDDYFANSNTKVITFARNLLDMNTAITSTSKVLGTIYLDVDLKVFDDIFAKLNIDMNDEIYILDANHTIIYSNQLNKISKKATEQDLSAEQFTQLSKEVDGTDWTIVVNFEQGSVIDQLSKTLAAIYLIIIGTVLGLIIVSILFSHRFTKPIFKMTKLMKNVESGEMDIRMNMNRQDEIGILANGFDKMLTNLNAYIKQVYISEIYQKQAELQALRSQIHPHYLYNTLEVIRMSAIGNDDDEVAEMIELLSYQLKYVMQNGSNQVLVAEEMEHIHSYLKLLKYRYEDQFTYEIILPSELERQLIPKLSIQPLVENAFLHGIATKHGQGKILIICEQDEKNQLKISVLDDGEGMDKERADQINLYLAGKETNIEKKGHGIGLKNVHRRLQEMYGETYGVTVTSKPNIGTMVILHAPWRDQSYV